MQQRNSRDILIKILQGAYSGELAAAYAYRGHHQSVKNDLEKKSIQKIEDEEWLHRRMVGQMLNTLQAKPQKLKEIKCWLVGRIIGFLCHCTGWFFPMYFAGRLESANTDEYKVAADCAADLQLVKFQKQLLAMSMAEKEHEDFFMKMVVGHKLLPLTQKLFGWGPDSEGVLQKEI